MSDTIFRTPVLFLVFNRLDVTQKVFKTIRKARPSKLYIASDGPRLHKAGEELLVEEVRQYILENIDWQCEIKTFFREINQGCGKAVEKAIDWFFENEEMGIILEDDCLPSESFFRFCEENLMKYKNDTRITGIAGNNFIKSKISEDSYFFSRYFFMWGWATWKSSWIAHQSIQENLEKILKNPEVTLGIPHKRANKKIIENAVNARNGRIDTWDYQWILSNYFMNGLIVTPSVNLVKNIGYTDEATHTIIYKEEYIITQSNLDFPLKHPLIFIHNYNYDKFLFNKLFRWVSPVSKFMNVKGLLKRIKKKVKVNITNNR